MKNLKQIRKQKGLTQKQLAQMINVEHTACSRYEKGISEPNIETLKKLSQVLSVSIDAIVGNDKMLSNKEQELLDAYGQLNNIDQEKALDYCNYLIKKSKEAKEKALRESIKKKG